MSNQKYINTISCQAKSATKMNIYRFMEIISQVIKTPEILNESRSKCTDFTRKRKMDFAHAVCFILQKSGLKLQGNLNIFFRELNRAYSMSRQASSQCRAKLRLLRQPHYPLRYYNLVFFLIHILHIC
jgi:hypothetical protein